MKMNQKAGKHAIVMGGSIGGLLAARVLSDYYEQVTILERDILPTSVENRRGVPQGRHTHGLLASGRQVLEDLFPGISSAMVRSGAVSGDIVRDGRWFFEGGCLSRCTSGLDGLLMSRPFLENMVRARVLQISNIRKVENCDAQGLATSADRNRVTGVKIQGGVLDADLVVDATGRGSRTPQWLEAMGFAKPVEERVEIGLTYTTRMFRRDTRHLNGDLAAVIPPTPKGKRGGVMLAQEDNRWTVTLIRHFGKGAPEDLPGFIEYSRTLPAPFIHEVIRGAEPIGDAVTSRFPASLRRRYEKLSRFPAGFLVFGDAISSFNPIYGQGMSVSALESAELAKALAEGSNNLAKNFFTRAAKVVDIPWGIAVGGDLRMPEAVGPRSLGVKLINWYMGRLHKAGHHDPVPTMAFQRVANLLAPPPSVMHPRVMLRVLIGNLRKKPRLAMPEQVRAIAAASGS